MMAEQSTLVSVEEYLGTSFPDGDLEYVDGHLVERQMGERDHSRLQTAIGSFLFTRRQKWGIHIYTEQRVQVLATRFRIPDICVFLGEEPSEQVFRTPPFL